MTITLKSGPFEQVERMISCIEKQTVEACDHLKLEKIFKMLSKSLQLVNTTELTKARCQTLSEIITSTISESKEASGLFLTQKVLDQLGLVKAALQVECIVYGLCKKTEAWIPEKELKTETEFFQEILDQSFPEIVDQSAKLLINFRTAIIDIQENDGLRNTFEVINLLGEGILSKSEGQLDQISKLAGYEKLKPLLDSLKGDLQKRSFDKNLPKRMERVISGAKKKAGAITHQFQRKIPLFKISKGLVPLLSNLTTGSAKLSWKQVLDIHKNVLQSDFAKQEEDFFDLVSKIEACLSSKFPKDEILALSFTDCYSDLTSQEFMKQYLKIVKSLKLRTVYPISMDSPLCLDVEAFKKLPLDVFQCIKPLEEDFVAEAIHNPIDSFASEEIAKSCDEEAEAVDVSDDFVEKSQETIALKRIKVHPRVKSWLVSAEDGLAYRNKKEALQFSEQEMILTHQLPEDFLLYLFSDEYFSSTSWLHGAEQQQLKIAELEIDDVRFLLEATFNQSGELYHFFARPSDSKSQKTNFLKDLSIEDGEEDSSWEVVIRNKKSNLRIEDSTKDLLVDDFGHRYRLKSRTVSKV